MRKKSTSLRQIVLLVVCAFTVSAYGQWRQFRNFTIKQNIKPPTNTILGVLGTSMGSRAQQSPYEHYSIPGLSDHKAVLAMSIQTDHLSKEIAALNRKNEDLKRKYESSMNNMAAKYEKAIKNLLKKNRGTQEETQRSKNAGFSVPLQTYMQRSGTRQKTSRHTLLDKALQHSPTVWTRQHSNRLHNKICILQSFCRNDCRSRHNHES